MIGDIWNDFYDKIQTIAKKSSLIRLIRAYQWNMQTFMIGLNKAYIDIVRCK